MRPAEQPRSFVVRSKGQECQRNRRHLLKVSEQNPEFFEKSQDPSIEENQIVDEESSKGAAIGKYSNVVVTRSGRISEPNPKYKDYHA